MQKRFLIAMVMTVAIFSVVGVAYAELGGPHNTDEPTWVKNMLNYGNDPKTQPGYGCAHGHKSFDCPETLD